MSAQSMASKDAVSGILFIIIGMAALYFGSSYAVGSLVDMGPGFFPLALSWALIGLGSIVLVKSFIGQSEPVSKLALRPLFFILASSVSFALLLPKAGFVLSAIISVAISLAAGRKAPLLESVLLVVGLTAASVGIFVFALGLPVPIWPRGF